jgi:hypothetical protein
MATLISLLLFLRAQRGHAHYNELIRFIHA